MSYPNYQEKYARERKEHEPETLPVLFIQFFGAMFALAFTLAVFALPFVLLFWLLS